MIRYLEKYKGGKKKMHELNTGLFLIKLTNDKNILVNIIINFTEIDLDMMTIFWQYLLAQDWFSWCSTCLSIS